MSEAELLLQLRLALRLVVAGVLAGFIGWEREQAGKPAGFRTHMVVGIAAALYVGTTAVVVQLYADGGSQMRIDPTRAIYAVATGIGFLGGGMILLTPDHLRVRGLTTAASVWATAAVGIAAGLGAWLLAVAATLLLVAVLRLLRPLDSPD